MEELIISQVREEQYQGLKTRRKIYDKLEKALGIPVISIFISFKYRAMLNDVDVDMLEGLLHRCKWSLLFGSKMG